MTKPRYMSETNVAVQQFAPHDGYVVLSEQPDPDGVNPFVVMLFTIRLARRLGVLKTVPWHPDQMPYSSLHDNIVFDAPLTSYMTGSRIRFLRGWKQYQSCVKGFNGLGLIAELVIKDLRRLQNLTPQERRNVLRTFLASRKTTRADGRQKYFSDAELDQLPNADFAAVPDLDVAIWRVCANRTIVCSTSSNMGISLHEILRYMQQSSVTVGGKSFRILNDDEGQLIIWCPDEEADFMNAEKAAALRAIEAEMPKLTSLHTYINRRQRDPGALKNALQLGGYFFPTNPQSRHELQNLLANAFKAMAEQRACKEQELPNDPAVRQLLETLSCRIEKDKVFVQAGAESGMSGLGAAYLLMLEETLSIPDVMAISTWNQASIGAALAGAVLADEALRDIDKRSLYEKELLAEELPNITRWLAHHQLGQAVKTRIHGLFDIANLQSLAQLLGVVVERHTSGRGTAYVGLGSSSYSNGNSCFDILRNSERRGGPFHGKTTFHPATHTINPIAQALVVAEDLFRVARVEQRDGIPAGDLVKLAAEHVRKPEPAGAAALAGYLLARLDTGTLSVAEIAYILRLAGFDVPLFLRLAGYEPTSGGANWFVQEASEEGENMEGLAQAFLHCLEMDIEELTILATNERTESQSNYRVTPIDPPDFEALEPVVNIYLTGDNTRQPDEALFSDLCKSLLQNTERLMKMFRDAPGYRPLPPPLQTLAGRRGLDKFADRDMLALVESIFARNANRTFLIDTASQRTLSYGELHGIALSIAGELRAQGLAKGDRVALLLPNGYPLVAFYFACMMAGIIAVPINPSLSAHEIGTILDLADPAKIFYSAATADRITDKVVTPRIRIFGNTVADSHGSTLDLPGAETVAWDMNALSAHSDIVPFADVSAEDFFLLLFTSGTTAMPKGVALSIAAELGNAVAFNTTVGFDRDARFYHVWPMAYSSGVLNTLFSPFMAEGSVVLANPFDARSSLTFWQPAMAHQADVLWLSPTMMASLLALDRDPRGPAYCREYIRTVCCGTAALPLPVKRNFEAKYGVEVMESYGLTELLIIAGEKHRYQKRDRSVGTALPGVEIRIARPDEEDADGIGGEILVSTPYAMLGYWDPKLKAVQPLEAGSFFPTGDVGRLDADGNLYITGRKKDLIIRGGVNVSPSAVREILLASPSVEDAVVVGMPNDFYGEEVVAAVILQTGFEIEKERPKILGICRNRLQPASVPTRVVALESFPKGATGKILVNEVKRLVASELASDSGVA
jgi:acyl-CoA synthetase (AMP-forming)/AMP-acid ligase II